MLVRYIYDLRDVWTKNGWDTQKTPVGVIVATDRDSVGVSFCYPNPAKKIEELEKSLNLVNLLEIPDEDKKEVKTAIEGQIKELLKSKDTFNKKRGRIIAAGKAQSYQMTDEELLDKVPNREITAPYGEFKGCFVHLKEEVKYLLEQVRERAKAYFKEEAEVKVD